MSGWSQLPTEADWDQLIAAVKSADSVLCLAHVSPDGDALGSSMAAAIAMADAGINARVSFDEQPFRLPGSLAWLPRTDLLADPLSIDEQPDVVVSFDASDSARLGSLAKLGEDAELFAALDHHRSYTDFADLGIVDVTAPATAVLALEFVDRLSASLTRDIASCVYAGLTTDTGSFRYLGTTAETHRIAARLHEAGIAHDEIARAVFDTHSLAAVKLLGRAIERIELLPDVNAGSGLAWTWITRSDREAFAMDLDAVEPVIDTVRTIAEAETAAVLKEGDDGVWRVSTRSKGAVDLGEVCLALGGGGHRLAAGFSSTDAPEVIIAKIVAQIESPAGRE